VPYVINQPNDTEFAEYSYQDGIFSTEECKQVISISKNIKKRDGHISTIDGAIVDKTKRMSNLYWIEWQSEYNWIFERLANTVFEHNSRFWKFHLAGLNEALQLTHYPGGKLKGHYDWHEDNSNKPGFSHRKLSGVVLLNKDFSGGKFEFARLGQPSELKMGTLILFPSYKTHRVHTVTKGNRWSLVFWVTGPPFC
jgi:PKHD-type hydroxylase